MNLTHIQATCPAAFAEMLTFYGEAAPQLREWEIKKLIESTCRGLYDFFDTHGVCVEVTHYPADDRILWEWVIGYFGPDVEANDGYATRLDAEHDGFAFAFKLLEKRLTA